MSKSNTKAPARTYLPVPEYVSDPQKLQALCDVVELDPATLLATVEQDYSLMQPLVHPAIYEARGAEKGGLLILILQQCKELAEGEENAGGSKQLGRTLQHVQAQLAVLMADYEEQLRQARQNADSAGKKA